MLIDKTAMSAWSTLAERASTAPLPYVAGWQAPVGLGVSCPVHQHPTIEIVYHRTGSGVTRVGPELAEHPFAEGSCVVYAPALPHDQIIDKAGEDLCVHIQAPERLCTKLKGCLVIPHIDFGLSDDWDRLTSGQSPRHPLDQGLQNLRATTALLSLLRECLTPPRKGSNTGLATVQRSEEYIREHFARIESMAEVASHVGLSHDRLRHLFREHRGASLVSFLNNVKIERARSLLRLSNLPLKQIATLCGFRDEYYFSTVFRKHTGQPPGLFREGNHRKGGAQMTRAKEKAVS